MSSVPGSARFVSGRRARASSSADISPGSGPESRRPCASTSRVNTASSAVGLATALHTSSRSSCRRLAGSGAPTGLREDLRRDSCREVRGQAGIGHGNVLAVVKRPRRAVEAHEIVFMPLVQAREAVEAFVVSDPRWKLQRVGPAAVIGAPDSMQRGKPRIRTIGKPARPLFNIEARLPVPAHRRNSCRHARAETRILDVVRRPLRPLQGLLDIRKRRRVVAGADLNGIRQCQARGCLVAGESRIRQAQRVMQHLAGKTVFAQQPAERLRAREHATFVTCPRCRCPHGRGPA